MQAKKIICTNKLFILLLRRFFEGHLLYIAYEQKFGNSRVSGEGEDD